PFSTQAPEVSAALKESGGRVKVAIVMLKAGVSAEEAAARLERQEGFVRRALERDGSTIQKKS
ncbi:MAG: hypothetical protein KY468_12565, partial [Armatimonadetes bacterium]|nr:hypothetical protein [Armatimonadota bacterium]